MGECPPTLPTSWGDLASLSLDPPSSPRQRRLFLSSRLFLQKQPPSESGTWGRQDVWVLGREDRAGRAGMGCFGSDCRCGAGGL